MNPLMTNHEFLLRETRRQFLGRTGTGLGLAIVKHFATALGGSVEVASEPGHGSVFTLLVPPASWNPPDEDDPTRSLLNG